ncbi:MAG: hypothetical protein LBG30_05240, partial [Odoribacteraceae bacterium]|nr:hypothetical protein [Odoribacteraceae bacterium]
WIGCRETAATVQQLWIGCRETAATVQQLWIGCRGAATKHPIPSEGVTRADLTGKFSIIC